MIGFAWIEKPGIIFNRGQILPPTNQIQIQIELTSHFYFSQELVFLLKTMRQNS